MLPRNDPGLHTFSAAENADATLVESTGCHLPDALFSTDPAFFLWDNIVNRSSVTSEKQQVTVIFC